MKKIITILLLITSFSICAQEDFKVEKYKSRYRFSGDNILMEKEPHIGVIGIGYDVFGLIEKFPNIYFGVNSYSALSGERSGVFSFGVASGYRKELKKSGSWAIDTGFFVGGGGGGGAADGGGLIIRPHIEIEKKISDVFSLFTGIAHINFLTGDINSTNINFGITINADSYVSKYLSSNKTIKKEVSLFSEKRIRIGLVGTMYNSFVGVPIEVDDPFVEWQPGNKVGLIGMSMERFITQNSFVILELNGAISGGVDGFMSYFLGVGTDIPIINNKLFLEARILGGPSGGGAVEVGGGASFQMEGGIGVTLFNDYELKLLGGKTFGPWGTLNTQHFDLQLSKRFSLYNGPEIGNLTVKDVSLIPLKFNLFNRTYIPPREKGVDNQEYDAFFNLIGFEVERELNNSISLLGSTIWAYQGSYGAYGEGWLGFKVRQDLNQSNSLNLKLMAGAAGGGALSVGGGFLFQYGFGSTHKINNMFDLLINAGQVVPLEGNFKPIFIDLGVSLNISQLMKK